MTLSCGVSGLGSMSDILCKAGSKELRGDGDS